MVFVQCSTCKEMLLSKNAVPLFGGNIQLKFLRVYVRSPVSLCLQCIPCLSLLHEQSSFTCHPRHGTCLVRCAGRDSETLHSS